MVSIRGRQNMGVRTRNGNVELHVPCHERVSVVPRCGAQNCTSLNMSCWLPYDYSIITWLSKAVISPRTTKCEFGRKYGLFCNVVCPYGQRKN